jgi:hypothetical protein
VVPEQRTASRATPTPGPVATPDPVRQYAESLAGGQLQPIEAPAPRAELVTSSAAPRAELIKLPTPKRLEDNPVYRERLRYKLERQRKSGVAQSME